MTTILKKEVSEVCIHFLGHVIKCKVYYSVGIWLHCSESIILLKTGSLDNANQELLLA